MKTVNGWEKVEILRTEVREPFAKRLMLDYRPRGSGEETICASGETQPQTEKQDKQRPSGRAHLVC